MLRSLAPRSGRAGLVSLLAAGAINAIGSKMSLLAVPWLVLVTTGSPVKMGLVGLAQTLPYVIAGIVLTPLVDRFGMRLVSILNDVFSALIVASIALFAQYDFAILMTLAAMMGTVQGVGDRAKRVLLQPVAEAAGVGMPRVVAIFASLNRVNTLVGLAIGGLVIAWIGPIGALWVDAVSYAVCATLVILLVHLPKTETHAEAPEPKPVPAKEPYFTALRNGFGFLRNERLLLSIVGMMFITNMFNQASGIVLIPLWVMQEFNSPVALGWVGGALALGAILGNLAFIGLVNRLPRYFTFILGYFIGGSPRFLVLGLTDDLRVVLGVTFVAGIASSVINPVYGALLYERVPKALQARVFGLTGAFIYGGIPLGGLVAAWFVTGFGLKGALIMAGLFYFAATLSPIFGYRIWKQMDFAPTDPAMAARRTPPPLPDWFESFVALGHRYLPPAVTGAVQPPITVTLTYAHREWTVSAKHGRRVLSKPRPIMGSEVLQKVKVLDLPEVYEAVEQIHAADVARLSLQAQHLRASIDAREAIIADLADARHVQVSRYVP